jgi:hypothetical protein
VELTGLSIGGVLGVLGAFGAVVTLLYFLKLRRRTVEVPFVRLWQSVLAEERTTRLFAVIKRFLSLLVALAVVGALAFALGDPRFVGARDEGTTSIVLVDASASMSATDVPGGRLEAARAEVRRRIAHMGPNDRMIVARMAGTTVPLGPIASDPHVLHAALARLDTADTPADLSAALLWALDVARDAPNAEIVVVSDGRVAAPGEDVSSRVRDAAIPVRWARIGAGGRNVGITAFAVRRYAIDASRAQVLVELWNPGDTAEDVELTLLGDGTAIDVSTLRIGAGERLPRVFENVTGADRTLEARIRFADGSRDALAADDAAYARLPERRRARVLAVTTDDIYLSAALLLDEYLEVVEVAPSELPPPGRFDVAIFDSFVPPHPYDADTIWLHPLPPEGVDGPFAIEGAIARPFFDHLERDHPLLRFTSLRDVNVAEALLVRTEPGDTVVGADERGPLLVAGERHGRRFVALTFDPRASDLPLRVAWPILLLNAIDSFARASSGYVSSYRTGEAWHVPVGDAQRAILVPPSGRERELPVVEGRAVASGEVAGFYTLRLERDGQAPIEEVLAANLGPGDEVILAPADTLPVAGPPVPPTPPASVALRSEPWTWLVAAAALILAIEWITFHRRWTV